METSIVELLIAPILILSLSMILLSGVILYAIYCFKLKIDIKLNETKNDDPDELNAYPFYEKIETVDKDVIN